MYSSGAVSYALLLKAPKARTKRVKPTVERLYKYRSRTCANDWQEPVRTDPSPNQRSHPDLGSQGRQSSHFVSQESITPSARLHAN